VGTYYPAASMYMGGTVKFNFGPDFKYPPSRTPDWGDQPWKPASLIPVPEPQPIPEFDPLTATLVIPSNANQTDSVEETKDTEKAEPVEPVVATEGISNGVVVDSVIPSQGTSGVVVDSLQMEVS
jgi:hypothetical protein